MTPAVNQKLDEIRAALDEGFSMDRHHAGMLIAPSVFSAGHNVDRFEEVEGSMEEMMQRLEDAKKRRPESVKVLETALALCVEADKAAKVGKKALAQAQAVLRKLSDEIDAESRA